MHHGVDLPVRKAYGAGTGWPFEMEIHLAGGSEHVLKAVVAAIKKK